MKLPIKTALPLTLAAVLMAGCSGDAAPGNGSFTLKAELGKGEAEHGGH